MSIKRVQDVMRYVQRIGAKTAFKELRQCGVLRTNGREVGQDRFGNTYVRAAPLLAQPARTRARCQPNVRRRAQQATLEHARAPLHTRAALLRTPPLLVCWRLICLLLLSFALCVAAARWAAAMRVRSLLSDALHLHLPNA